MNAPAAPEPDPPEEVARLRARVAELEAALARGESRAISREQETRALLNTLFATAPVGLGFVDSDLRFIQINENLAEINGLSPAAHLGRTIEEVIPELAGELKPHYRHVLATGEAITDLEVRGFTAAAPDQPRDWLVSYYPVRSANEAVIGVGVVVLEITARKRAEEDMRRVAERLQMLHAIDRAILNAQTTEQIATVVISRLRQLVSCERASILTYAGEQGQVRVILASDAEASRFPAGSSIPLVPEDLRPPYALDEAWYVEDLGCVSSVAPHAIDYGRLGFRSLIHLPLIAEGSMLGALRLSAERPHAFASIDITIAMDVADQLAIAMRAARLREQLEEERELLARRVEERTAELRIANGELARAARLKDEFLANMSHELRTPLNTILGHSELLLEQIYGSLTGRQATAMRSIEEAGRHLLALINDILDISKIEAGMLTLDPGMIDVEDVCRAAIRMVSQVAMARRINLVTTYDSQVETMVADERRLKQILVNLLANAVKFTPEGGRVGLEVRGDPERQTATFIVWDTGIGIAAEEQQLLFRPFVQLQSQLSREQNGTGLGLALVRRLAELHGGQVSLESTVGVGSRFQIVLPWARPARAQEEAPLAEATDETTPTIRQTLIIDDSPSATEQVARYLHELGSQVVVHRQAAGALDRAGAIQPDLIILDIVLPGGSGWDLLRQLKADPRTAPIPVLVVSVIDDPATAHLLGASAALLKPISREAFVRAVQGLPARPRPPAASEPAGSAAPEPSPLPVVLLADDNADNVQVLSDFLTASGYQVAVAHNGAEAVDRAQEIRPAIILMDIQMPVLDGLEAIRRIRAAGMNETPIVAVTALAMPGDRERCLSAGADDYLTKPISLRTLRTLIAQLISARS